MRARTPQSKSVLSHSAVRRGIIALMETGWVVRTVKGRGKGKTASRYVPTLNVLDLAAMGKFPELLHDNGAVEGNSELLHDNETVHEKLLHHNETVDAELLHDNGAKTPILDLRTLDPHGPSMSKEVSAAPATAGLAAAEPASGEFERIWLAYGKLGSKKASREAFAAIENPDVVHIAERAAAWAGSARPGQKRMPLEKWLVAEKYDEADRRVAVKERPKPKAGVSTQAPATHTPRVCQIIAADVSPDEYGSKLSLVFEVMGDRSDTFHHAVYIEHHDHRLQSAGMEEFGALCRVMNLPEVEDAEELMFHPLLVTQKRGGTLAYDCAPANFDMQEAA